jgi:hypothetical protein
MALFNFTFKDYMAHGPATMVITKSNDLAAAGAVILVKLWRFDQ